MLCSLAAQVLRQHALALTHGGSPQEFAKSSEEAVNAVSPVGGYLLSKQILSK